MADKTRDKYGEEDLKEVEMNISENNWVPFVRKFFSGLYEEQYHTTFYIFLFDFLPAVADAHSSNDAEFLKRAYAFAESCFRSKEFYIKNAIAVAFYEHFTDRPSIRDNFLSFVPKDIIEECILPLTKEARPENYDGLVKLVKKRYKGIRLPE